MAYFLGFDPGGVGVFGWAVGRADLGGRLTLVATGNAPNAEVAVDTAIKFTEGRDSVRGAGIDAPLFWTPTGVRQVDALVRREMHRRGAKTPSGTVQQLNSLRGACLVQGVVCALLLRERLPAVPITETHPKALLWLLNIASPDRPHARVQLRDLATLLHYEGPDLIEHERDAAISVSAALAMHEQREGWTDLVRYEPRALHVVPGGVTYWMPALPIG